MSTVLGWLYFLCIQIVALVLGIIGIPLAAALLLTSAYSMRLSRYFPARVIAVWRGGALTWLWGNEEDGVFGPQVYNPSMTKWRAFVWSALRNPVGNLRFLVAWKGGPWFQYRGNGWYFQMGFRPDRGWPVLSAGSGTGTQL